ncbi:hypothetical protein PSN45_002378 [Yamadazyma tenuis]|uniref:VPS9 domain-containing protein n=1 Tax=Candida tenuis (strain ATCC 10573 / BCRC 21748 / CBS 615 / JCM 9827 / NBRC 10315 / NRRL Y-1498 / VKM Y-70) TaxID=590646 RepID=G3B0P0_CANTC|nr:uncharacterized protein CANTEDRAFT_102569 [Yamadazyma tenuis ATCC 10573]EGV65439.1 hypothetical protein CANTEDRAFT_102569 [Yamadazyma tenuis ATCC 10573]WEJ94878.1 hypothetical protein PSN45_002378 [Yamadazyma tenuis]
MSSPPYDVISVLQTEIEHTPVQNPSVNQLIQGFIKYLKEPRYSTPLTIQELSGLFHNFYNDLNSTVITVYTQSNSAKKQLIGSSEYFKENPKQYDYLLAIANYSSSSIKLVRRTDSAAVLQLRVFNMYKFLLVTHMIESSQELLLQSTSNKDDDISLYDKIFRFDEKDLVVQEFFDKKLKSLKRLNLPFQCFIEEDNQTYKSLIELINTCDTNENIMALIKEFTSIKDQVTASSKLRMIARFQKNLMRILSTASGLQSHNINNDVLLPVFIYLIIYKMDVSLDLFLTFNYVKNFTNFIDPYDVKILASTSFYFYNPTETSKNHLKNNSRKANLFECINLNENETDTDAPDADKSGLISFFDSDKELIHYLNINHLNNSELQYYLTNFEAVLFFIQNVTLDELTDRKTDEEILSKPLSVFVERAFAPAYEFPPRATETNEEDTKDEETDVNRSRSSSLFNTISNRISEAANRSRSNSALMRSTGESVASIEVSTDAVIPSPVSSPTITGEIAQDSTTFNMMRNIIGRFGSVSVSQFKGSEEEEGLVNNVKHLRSASIIEKLSPNHSRTRSSSLENGTSTMHNLSPSRKNTIASKLSSGVTDLMTKFNTPATASSSFNHQNTNTSQTSLRSLDESESVTVVPRRPDHFRNRTSSIQIMEKWFNNLSTGQQQQLTQTQTEVNASTSRSISQSEPSKPEVADIESHEGSVFSTPSKELAKYHNVDFDLLTVSDLRTLKLYYDQLCNELGMSKFESKSTSEELNDQFSSVNSI